MALDVKQPKGYRKAWNGGVRPVTGVDLIADERARQMSAEGWSLKENQEAADEAKATQESRALRSEAIIEGRLARAETTEQEVAQDNSADGRRGGQEHSDRSGRSEDHRTLADLRAALAPPLEKEITMLQLAVLGILDNAAAYRWSVQGFGLLRLYIRDVGRLHIWDSALRYPNVSMIHNHSWDLRSTVVSGRIVNTRFAVSQERSIAYQGKRLVTGYQTRDVLELGVVGLEALAPEDYCQGDTYSQLAHEIHRTDADDGTVSLMARKEDENGQADVYWPVGTTWGTAKPRPATDEEVRATVAKALKQFAKGAALAVAPPLEEKENADHDNKAKP